MKLRWPQENSYQVSQPKVIINTEASKHMPIEIATMQLTKVSLRHYFEHYERRAIITFQRAPRQLRYYRFRFRFS